MMHEYRRCTHCGVRYTYQSSGHCDNPLNHGDWCADCYQVVRTALSGVPRRYERRSQSFREIPRYEGIPLDRFLAWEAIDDADRAQRSSAGQVVARRIGMPLFNLKTGDSQNVRGVRGHDEFEGHFFMLATWQHDPDYDATVEMEYDLIAGQFTGRPWSGTTTSVTRSTSF